MDAILKKYAPFQKNMDTIAKKCTTIAKILITIKNKMDYFENKLSKIGNKYDAIGSTGDFSRRSRMAATKVADTTLVARGDVRFFGLSPYLCISTTFNLH